MKVILLQNIKKLGSRYDIVEVAPGFANNFLIPQEKAIFADKAAVASIETTKNNQAEAVAQERAAAEKMFISVVESTELTFSVKANEAGTFYKAITDTDLAKLISGVCEVELSDNYLVLQNPIKEVGTHAAVLMYDADLKKNISVVFENSEA